MCVEQYLVLKLLFHRKFAFIFCRVPLFDIFGLVMAGGCDDDRNDGNSSSYSNKNPFEVTKAGCKTESKRPLFYCAAFYRSAMAMTENIV